MISKRLPSLLVVTIACAVVALLVVAAPASALPRFSARTGGECIQCHVNPTGGAMRNAYGRGVFELASLPMARQPSLEDWMEAEDVDAAEDAEAQDAGASEDADVEDDAEGYDAEAFDEEEYDGPLGFSGELTEGLAIGSDLRAAWFYIQPDEAVVPGEAPSATNTFFLMQADLYVAAELNEHVVLALDIGIYSGFEAWALFRLDPEPEDFDLMVKVGRFMPAFGIRAAEHQLFTRAAIGLGEADRDTGIEVSAYAGPVGVNLSVLNGTLGATHLDRHGSERRTFEKAFAARLSLRGELGPVRAQVGGSFYFNENVSQPNPLFTGAVPDALIMDLAEGLNEVRAGAFLTASVGRFTYLADLAFVRDDFYGNIAPVEGYATYQELSFLATQGLDFVTTFEFMDPDLELLDNAAMRAGFIVEFFPWTYTELRAMVRRTWHDASPTGGAWDVVLFAHLFM